MLVGVFSITINYTGVGKAYTDGMICYLTQSIGTYQTCTNAMYAKDPLTNRDAYKWYFYQKHKVKLTASNQVYITSATWDPDVIYGDPYFAYDAYASNSSGTTIWTNDTWTHKKLTDIGGYATMAVERSGYISTTTGPTSTLKIVGDYTANGEVYTQSTEFSK